MGTTTPAFSSSTYATNVAITSNAAADGYADYYKTNDLLRVSISFTEAVTVIGSPMLQINIGGQIRTARFQGGSGTDTLNFIYTIGADTDSNGVSVAANALVTNGALIRNALGQTFSLSTPAMADAVNHKVDTTRPGGLTMSDIAGDYFITANEAGSVVINGTAEAGGFVRLAFDSGFSRQIAVTNAGTWSYTLTAADLDAMDQGLEYITATATDAAGNLAYQQIQRVVMVQTHLGESTPRIQGASGALGDEQSVRSMAENSASVHTFTSDKTVTWSLNGGADASRFQINATTGALSFVAAANFEAPQDTGADNQYVVVVRATDSLGLVSDQTLTVNVTNANDNAPVITSGASASFAENGVGAAYIATATDADNLGALTYSIGGSDATRFNINASTGVVSFQSSPDFEVPTDVGANNVYDISVSVSDGVHTTTQAVSIQVTNADESLAAPAAPMLSAVALDNQTSVDVRTNIVLNFDHNLTAVAGKYIRIVDDGGVGYRGESTTNTQVIQATDPRVTILGGRVTINPEFDLDFSSNYHVEIDAGAFVSTSTGAAFAGISNSTTVNFSTVAPAAGGSAGAASVTADAAGAMVASMHWWDISSLGSPIAFTGFALNAAGGNNAYVTADFTTTSANAANYYDGVGVGDFNVRISNFGAGDLLYIDNHGANQSVNDTAGTCMIDMVTSTLMIWEGASGTGALGGQVEIDGLGFETVNGWKNAIGAGYAPYVIA